MDYKHKSDLATLHARNDDFELRMKSKYFYYIFLNVVTVLLVILTIFLMDKDGLNEFLKQVLKIPNIVKLMLLIALGLLIVQ
jgi:uncharacterized integral membrane protein